jgi:hypothetical protein
MTRPELIERLFKLKDDPKYAASAHAWADDALLEFINDPEVTRAYGEIDKCYG